MSCFLHRGTTRVLREQLCDGIAQRSQPSLQATLRGHRFVFLGLLP